MSRRVFPVAQNDEALEDHQKACCLIGAPSFRLPWRVLSHSWHFELRSLSWHGYGTKSVKKGTSAHSAGSHYSFCCICFTLLFPGISLDAHFVYHELCDWQCFAGFPTNQSSNTMSTCIVIISASLRADSILQYKPP